MINLFLAACGPIPDKLWAIQAELKVNLQWTQERYKEQHDRHTKPGLAIVVGDEVWLNRRTIRMTQPSQKLDVKYMGPFKVLEVVREGKLAYKLELPVQMLQTCGRCQQLSLEPTSWSCGVVELWSCGVTELWSHEVWSRIGV